MNGNIINNSVGKTPPYPQTVLPASNSELDLRREQSPPYPTMPYPGFVSYKQTTNSSSDSLLNRINNRPQQDSLDRIRNDSIQSTSTFNSQFSSTNTNATIREEVSGDYDYTNTNNNNIDALSNYLQNVDLDEPEYVTKYRLLKKQSETYPNDIKIQIKWIYYLFEITTIEEFVSKYNYDTELLNRKLSSSEYKKNELVFIKKAVKLLKKLVIETSNSDLQFLLGSLYSQSPIIKIVRPNILEKNYEKSFDNYLKAATQSHPMALYRLGISYELGIGTSINFKASFNSFLKSAELGNIQSMFKLGMIYSRNELNSKINASIALNWLIKASKKADFENPYSLYELGKIYEFDSTLNEEFLYQLNQLLKTKNEPLALDYYKEAAKLKYPPAQCKLGYCYEFGKLGLSIDAKKSIGWYSRSAQNGFHVAEMALSGWYLTGAKGILEPNDKEAFLWASKSCESGFIKAEYALGYYYEVGLGCEKNLQLSKKYYIKAATKGHQKAIERLRTLNNIN